MSIPLFSLLVPCLRWFCVWYPISWARCMPMLHISWSRLPTGSTCTKSGSASLKLASWTRLGRWKGSSNIWKTSSVKEKLGNCLSLQGITLLLNVLCHHQFYYLNAIVACLEYKRHVNPGVSVMMFQAQRGKAIIYHSIHSVNWKSSLQSLKQFR